MPEVLDLTQATPLSITSLILNLIIGAIISVILAFHFIRFGRTMSNRAALAQVFPLIVLTTILVISVVKSSLALSLGLVGALSIVRFRTPIKEPEELAYLFFAIGVGLGLGADHRITTIVASIAILGVLTGRAWFFRRDRQRNLYLNIDVPSGADSDTLEEITGLLRQNTIAADARRMDIQNDTLQATYFVDCQDESQLRSLLNNLKASLPEASITLLERGRTLDG